MEEDKKLFDSYYENFNINEYGIYMKYDHTMRVVDDAELIAKSLNLSNEDIILAKKCALYHDIARFSQWTEYKTFYDYNSFDHGKEGVNILNELGIKDDIILKSTYYHNKYEVDNSLDDRTKLFCNITRDADKIDIMLEHKIVCSDESINVTDSIMETFKNHRQLSDKDLVEQTTFTSILRIIAFIFDINYKKSFEIIKEKDIVNKKFDLILSRFDNDKVKELKDICNKYIEDRCF